jgi:MoaA/NifB/PqqE/SkfB family radical SAM enzyme
VDSSRTNEQEIVMMPSLATLPLAFNDVTQCFVQTGEQSVDTLVDTMTIPLSLTFQLTRNCNLRCIYCSEPPGIRERQYEQMIAMLDKLAGMRRIIFSGGEPMLHPRFWDILEHVQGKFEKIVLSTNATRITAQNVGRLRELVHYIDITVDGPRRQHDGIRGNYDSVMRGLIQVAAAGIPFSTICVFLPGNRDAIHYIAQTGDALGAVKTKILTPIPKGRSVNIFEDFVTGEQVDRLADFLLKEKEKNGWKIRITITDWMRVGKGHAILIEPDGRAIASPVWETPDCIEAFGSLHDVTAQELWHAYPYKSNHLRKYLEQTLVVV